MNAATASDLVRAAIAEQGRITFAEFMEIALYAPGVGFYTSSPGLPHGGQKPNGGQEPSSGHTPSSDRKPSDNRKPSSGHTRSGEQKPSDSRKPPVRHSRESGNPSAASDAAARAPEAGPPRDYYTAPQLHGVFGTYLARHVAQIWRQLGSPQHFDVVEMGAGRGILGWDVLRALRRDAPACWEAVCYRMVERGPGPGPAQRRALAAAAPRPVSVRRALDDPVAGVVLSNELLDALPTHRVRMRRDTLEELYITLDNGHLVEEWGEPSRPELTAYVADLGRPAPGWQGEICLAAITWLEDVARLLDRGTMVTIDYGATWAELCGPRHSGGTLACYYRHGVSTDPYQRIGAQDITAHVNFSALMERGAQLGLRTARYESQAEYLLTLGIGEELAALARQPVSAAALRRKRAITDLIWPDGLGGFRVLIQETSVLY